MKGHRNLKFKHFYEPCNCPQCAETARTNAMLRRANRIMDNTQASLNMSSHLEQNAHTPESSDTEELLAGDQELMTRVQTR